MRRFQKSCMIALALIAAISLTGCLQSEKTVTVRPDGSGVVEERFLMRTQFVEMLSGMASSASGEEFSLLDEEELQGEAAEMGGGVTFQSAEPLQTNWGQGYVARYTFEDINNLRVNQNPGDNVPSPQGGSPAPDTETTEYMRFSFTPGSTAELNIRMPEPDESGESGDGGSDDGSDIDAEQFEQVRQIYQDMRITLRFRFEDSIVSTNATHRDGNTITIMDMNFNEILENPDVARNLMSNEADSLAEVQRALQDYPGIQVEFQRDLTVRFR